MKAAVTPTSSKEISGYRFHLLASCISFSDKAKELPALRTTDGCLRFCPQPKHLQNPSGHMTVLMFAVFTLSKQHLSMMNDLV
jgi:hypothetical protein